MCVKFCVCTTTGGLIRVVPPILFLVFNRVDTAARVFDSIRSARPEKLYLAADGPRANQPGELQRCLRVRELVTSIDWPCEVRTLFREENLGCKLAVSGALNWFFEHEPEGIILEDDCLPGDDFYEFCSEMLSRYRQDDRVAMVTGNNFQRGRQWGEGSYYFSRFTHIWGWACWRRSWLHYDGELAFWPELRRSRRWRALFDNILERLYWHNIFSGVYAGKHDSWAYPWMASVWNRGGLTVTPNVNLVKNIGFGLEATHTFKSDTGLAVESQPLGNIIHPVGMDVNRLADDIVFKNVYRDSMSSLIGKIPGLIVRKMNELRDS